MKRGGRGGGVLRKVQGAQVNAFRGGRRARGESDELGCERESKFGEEVKEVEPDCG